MVQGAGETTTPPRRSRALCVRESESPVKKRRLNGKTPASAWGQAQSQTPSQHHSTSSSKPKPPADTHTQRQTAQLAEIKAQLAQKGLFLRASEALQPQATSGELPCREEEQELVSSHLRLAIRSGGSSNVLYVSGMPGTGKTASVLRAVEKLQAKGTSQEGVQCKFTFVHVNAMCLNQPHAFYGEMLQQLRLAGADSGSKRRCAAGPAMDKLQTFFERRESQDPVVVLLIDELDCLATRNQAVLYRIFNWLMLPMHRLVIVAISNTMDLPERLLPRVSSRFGLVRVDFWPYKKDQINEILRQRLDSQGAGMAFEPAVLKLCAARIAAGSGDIRKALQLCRRALELRQQPGQKTGPVSLEHLREAEKDILHANPSAVAVRHIGRKARLFLSAFVLERRKREAEAVPFRKVSSRYAKLLAALQLDDPDFEKPCETAQSFLAHRLEEATFLLRRLESMSLVVQQLHRQTGDEDAEASGSSKGPLLSLAALDLDELSGALQEAETSPAMLELLRESV